MLTYILIAVAVALVVFLLVIAMQPSDFRFSRTALMSALPDAVFPHVNDFHEWEAWSPYERIDPAMKRTFTGAPSGTGAEYAWTGNSRVGEGHMTITESHPSDLIRIDLEFLKPFKASNVAEFTFKTAGDQTSVTWSMTGKNNFMAKAAHMIMNMDKMLGGQFEQGLAQMKSIVEGGTRQ